VPEESLLTPEVRALIGSARPPTSARVTLRAVNRAMDVYLGHHDHALGPGDPVPGYVLAAIEPETEIGALPSVLPDSLLISNEWQFERPLRLGEELTLTARLADISERFGGRFGYSLYFRSDVEFRDAAGTVVARSSRTMMQYDSSEAREGAEDDS
jgi:hypothetical protein